MTISIEERSPEDKLQILALYANEKMLYTPYPHWKPSISNEVRLDVVEVKNLTQSGGTFPYVWQSHQIIVRASTLINERESVIKELSWEGPLQDWYQACATVVKQISEGK
jgi:hypothetical protein